MTLETIKLQTTWNDAAGSINSNFSKILQVLASINGGGTGGGGIDEAELLEFLVENGYITEDYLADFYTKGQSDAKFATITAFESLSSKIGKIESAGYITSEALSPYLKTSDAESTFATIASLGGVDERLKEIEEYFNGSGEDADNKINKWNEIVAFLNATEDTTLAGILAAYTLKTDHNALAARVKTNEDTISGINTTLASHTSTLSEHTTAIATLGNKVNPIDTWYNEVGKYFKKDSDGMWYVDGTGRFSGLLTASAGISTPHITIGGITISVVDGVLRIDGNVYTTGQLGVGAVGQEGGGTGGGGVLLLNTWPTDGGSYAGYALGGNLGIDLNTRVKTLEGKATAVSFSQTLTSGKQIGVLTIDGSSSVLYAPSSYSWSEITSRPSKLSDFTDDVVSGKYLPLTGGTISGTSVAPLIINTSASESSVVFRINSDSKTQIGYNPYLGSFIYNYSSSKSIGIKDDGTPHYNGNTIYHAGNFNPADYLPLTGGTITRNLIIASANDSKIVLNETGEDYKYQLIEFQDHGTMYGVLGTMGSGDLVWNGSTIIHSGNIGSQIVEGVNAHQGDAINAGGDITKLNAYYSSGAFRLSRFNGLNGLGTKNADGLIVNWPLDYAYGQQWYMDDESHTIQTRYVSGGTWSGWKTIAFTDSNVASAESAKVISDYSNSRITSADVEVFGDGGVRKFIASSYMTSGKPPKDGSILHFSWDTTSGYEHQLFIANDKSATPEQRMAWRTQDVGVWGDWKAIAFTDSNVASATKLATARTIWGQSFDGTGGVDGYMFMSGLDVLHLDESNLWLNYGAADDGKSLRLCGNDVAIYYGKSSNFARAMTINSSGNVGIGTADPKYKLDVSGDLRIYGDVYFFDSSGNNRITFTHESDIARIYNNGNSSSMYIGEYSGKALNIVANNIGIGTANPAYKLDVAGSIRTTSSLTIGTIVLTDENGTLKIAGNAYTTGQLGAGEAGQPTSGGGNVILDYDSIVDALGFTPAKQNDLSSLTSRVLALESAGPSSSSSSLYGDEITIGSSMGNIYISSENDVQIDSIMGSVLVNGSEALTKANTAFTRNYSSGTKIGTIKIGGASTDIFVPTSSSSNLWTTEYSIDVGNDVLAASKEYIGTNTIVGWDLAGSCLNDLYIGYDGYTIWMQGSVDEASDMRLKTVIDAVNLDIRDIAFAPIFNYVFKSRPQGRQMLGSSAQYWQAIAPKAVSENDKGNLAMNYGAIALASVVAVAKKVVTHEEEIAELKSKVQSLETRLAKYELN